MSASYSRLFGKYNYLWDELAALAWLDPSLITAKETRYLDVDLNRGAGYGNTLSWTEHDKPTDRWTDRSKCKWIWTTERFYKMFVDLLTAPTPKTLSSLLQLLERLLGLRMIGMLLEQIEQHAASLVPRAFQGIDPRQI